MIEDASPLSKKELNDVIERWLKRPRFVIHADILISRLLATIDALREERDEYKSVISWHTCCPMDAKRLDQLRTTEERAEKAENETEKARTGTDYYMGENKRLLRTLARLSKISCACTTIEPPPHDHGYCSQTIAQTALAGENQENWEVLTQPEVNQMLDAVSKHTPEEENKRLREALKKIKALDRTTVRYAYNSGMDAWYIANDALWGLPDA